jgi:cytochrome c5
MKKIVIVFAAIIFVYGCSQKTTPTTASTAKPTKSTEEVAIKTAVATVATNVPVAETKEKMTEAEKPLKDGSLSVSGVVAVADTKEPGQVVEGGEIYRAKCGKCHDLKDPKEYNATKWVKVVEWMAPRAKLDAREKDNVIAYVSFHAKK